MRIIKQLFLIPSWIFVSITIFLEENEYKGKYPNGITLDKFQKLSSTFSYFFSGFFWFSSIFLLLYYT